MSMNEQVADAYRNWLLGVKTQWLGDILSDMPIRARKALVRLRVESIDQLAAVSANDLLECTNCGEGTVSRVADVMQRHGMTLKDWQEDEA